MSSPAQDPATHAIQEAIHSHWVLLVFQGLIMAVLGLVAIAKPIMAASRFELLLS